ncbi:single-stranded-DNA-specific exonuclease RecJ [Clostridium sp. AM25-23AC]|jgi:single-stranded-DNA-specific exonuclease|uniref:single-stranded-DNA-specific exonuclease RecJ n=1 Tax=Clostridium sp. AM25-23AC TaxID=2305240 RepID=UPI000E412183|nr:single-stranded-DNA-specific exonuclease RecJ [Clostridium sp. AM25-23AC]RGD96223.1 single-stranded-DNA-specific exonuclease RecJ [Clostridium sp. AM25-23AC]RGE09544.1 single-stranded-DNA-specific exonuclease RecJ [Clostridiaceae bacterium TF01-6]
MQKKKEIWMLQTKRADFNGLAMRLGVSPVAVRIMRNRGLLDEREMRKYLYGTLDDLYDPRQMKGMETAAGIIEKKLIEGKKIRIIGDYDIDGVCSTYILLKGFHRAAGNGQIDYEIPDRIRDGYGINESIIRQAAEDGIDTLVTCDNGIAALKEISIAKQLGMTVVVTDHHEVPVDVYGQILPPADAVVDPKQDGETYPYHEICGAVVAWKLINVIYEDLGIPEHEWMELLEFAAIATVGDVMKLQDENRLIVKYGLKKIGSTKNTGLRMLVEKNNLDINNLSAYHIGFVIGPCLNAGGRLKSAKVALRMLLEQDPDRVSGLADELKELNDVRKDMTAKGETEAIEQVERFYMSDKVLVVFLPECHESLAGIIAGRLREHFHKPSFVLTRGEQSAKGSGRSIEAYHMYQGLCEVSDLLVKFGGHPMAAGLSIEESDIDEFRRRLNENAKLTEDDFVPQIWIDVPMPFEYVNEKIVDELKGLEPFGQGNEKPLFAQKSLTIRNVRVLGKNRNVVKMNLVTNTGHPFDGLLFADGDRFLEEQTGQNTIDMIYYPDVNEYNGTRTLQAIIKNYKFR